MGAFTWLCAFLMVGLLWCHPRLARFLLRTAGFLLVVAGVAFAFAFMIGAGSM